MATTASGVTEGNADWEVRRSLLDDQDIVGLSGLGREPDGSFWWAIPETAPFLARLELLPGRVVSKRIPIDGLPEGIEAESLARIGDGRFAIGTERNDPRDRDRIFLLEKSGEERLRVAGSIDFDYSLWKTQGRGNRGLEGLCASEGLLFALSETTIDEGGRRWSPLGRRLLGDGEWTPFRLALTTEKATFSSLGCRSLPGGEEVELLVIERTFGIGRIHRVVVPRRGPGRDLEPEMIVDLTTVVREIQNFEGIEWRGEGHYVMVIDNMYHSRQGPTEVVELVRKH
jgi:hypothetical protein